VRGDGRAHGPPFLLNSPLHQRTPHNHTPAPYAARRAQVSSGLHDPSDLASIFPTGGGGRRRREVETGFKNTALADAPAGPLGPAHGERGQGSSGEGGGKGEGQGVAEGGQPEEGGGAEGMEVEGGEAEGGEAEGPVEGMEV
jgi:hypothetical protein